jgi:hypothetical protein
MTILSSTGLIVRKVHDSAFTVGPDWTAPAAQQDLALPFFNDGESIGFITAAEALTFAAQVLAYIDTDNL